MGGKPSFLARDLPKKKGVEAHGKKKFTPVRKEPTVEKRVAILTTRRARPVPLAGIGRRRRIGRHPRRRACKNGFSKKRH